MRSFAAACALAASVAFPALAPGAQTSPPAAPAADSDALVRAALEAPHHVSYVGELQTIRWGTRDANATIQRIEHLAPASTRRTFLAPEALYGEYDITLGTTTTKIDPREHRAMVSENPSSNNEATLNSNIALLISNYRAVLGPVEMVAARPATTVSFVNKYTGERMMRLWIDNETKVVLAKEAYHQDGSLAWRSRFDAIRFTNEIPSDVFSTAIPPGFQEVSGRRFADITDDLQRTIEQAGFTPANPHYLPEGFHVIGAENSTFGGIHTFHLLYSDGIRTLSLFENDVDSEPDFDGMKPELTHVDGHDAEYVKDGPTTLLSWHEDGLAFTLIGDLDLKGLTDIATSVTPP
jgi:negative regulator of sigma E activity